VTAPARRSFLSDNGSGLCPEALAAMVDANVGGHAVGYGDDPWTRDAEAAFRDLFGADTAVFFVATGTAANVLAIAAISEAWQRVVCHRQSHYALHESTAPERIAGVRAHPIGSPLAKLTPDDLREIPALAPADVHAPQPGVLTVSQASEFGSVYDPQQLRSLCDAAHAAGYRVHVDGARFANAVAALGCPPRALAGDAGVDALCFGGTKNGLAFGEAVLFFRQGDGEAAERAARIFPFHRKSTGHLLSKHRFAIAPFAATLASGAWLRHAAHANAMAARLAAGLQGLGIDIAVPVETNAVFAAFPKEVARALDRAGYPHHVFGGREASLARLMCSFDTQTEDIDAFLAAAATAS